MNWNDEGLLRSIVRLLRGGEFELSPAEPSDGSVPAMWVTLIPDRRRLIEYIDGSGSGRVTFDVMLRYRSISPADSLRAIRILEDTAHRAVCSGEIFLSGTPVCVGGNGSSALYSARFEYSYSTSAGEVSAGREERYFVNVSYPDKPLWVRIGHGFSRFNMTFRRDPDERRYIERRDIRVSRNGVCRREIEFAFDRNAQDEIRDSILGGECCILSVGRDGKALRHTFVLTEANYGDTVTGTLVSTGDETRGIFCSDGTFESSEEVRAGWTGITE